MFVSAIADVLVDESSCHAWFMRTPLHREAPSDYAADCRPLLKEALPESSHTAGEFPMVTR